MTEQKMRISCLLEHLILLNITYIYSAFLVNKKHLPVCYGKLKWVG